ncbi:unnamed protein product, partial [Linum tenue]
MSVHTPATTIFVMAFLATQSTKTLDPSSCIDSQEPIEAVLPSDCHVWFLLKPTLK